MTLKAIQTREQILTAALDLFAKKGYGATTLRDIAAEADVSLGLTYRYFAGKEEFVLALYERLAQETAEETMTIERGRMGDRFEAAMSACLSHLQPHRKTLESLFAVGLSSDSELAVFGDRASNVRALMIDVYRRVLEGATDRPKPQQLEQITTLLYAAHMLIVLFWLQDRTEGQSSTHELVKVMASLMRFAKPILALPIVSTTVASLHRIMYPMFGPSTSPPIPA